MNENNDRLLLYFVSRTAKIMSRFVEKNLAEKGLDGLISAHGNILAVLYRSSSPMTMGDIAARIGRDKSTVTPLAEKLVRLGYIEKVPGSRDRRNVYLVLTEKGRSLRPIFEDISEQLFQTAWDHFSIREKEDFLESLKKIYLNFQSEEKNQKIRT